MFKKNPEKYRGPLVIVLTILVMILIVVQFYFTTIPCIPAVDMGDLEIEGDEVERVYSMTDVMYTKTQKITQVFRDWTGNWKFSINPYADMTAYANGLGITVIIMSLISLKCFATHIVSVVWAFWAPIYWMKSKIWEIATLPVADTIYTVTQITLFAGSALVLIKTGIYLYHRFFIPFLKWRKATAEWKAEYDAAVAADAAAKAEAAN